MTGSETGSEPESKSESRAGTATGGQTGTGRRAADDFARIVAAGLACLVGPAGIAAIGQPISARGIAWLVAGAVAIAGLARWDRRAGRTAVGLAIAAWLVTIALSLAWPASESPFLRAIELPSGAASSRLGRIFAERDVALVGARLARIPRWITSRELDGFAEPLARTYDELDDDGVASTPFVHTALGMQDASSFDALVHEEGDRARWVVFLHGFGGLFASYCGVVARIASRQGWSTICPATSFDGRWDRDDGPEIARTSLAWARARGATRIVLAGLSNGGIGASRLATTLDGDLAGLILLSGSDPSAAPPEIPTLVWHGTNDERFPIRRVREWTSALPHAELVEVDGDHFALIEQRTELGEALTTFLRLRR